jgi:hypothetical protein
MRARWGDGHEHRPGSSLYALQAAQVIWLATLAASRREQFLNSIDTLVP